MVKDGGFTWMGYGVLVAIGLAIVWAYHHGFLNMVGMDGYKKQSDKKAAGFAKYVATTAVIGANNRAVSSTVDSTALPLYGSPGASA
jgi:hypothetical protein